MTLAHTFLSFLSVTRKQLLDTSQLLDTRKQLLSQILDSTQILDTCHATHTHLKRKYLLADALHEAEKILGLEA